MIKLCFKYSVLPLFLLACCTVTSVANTIVVSPNGGDFSNLVDAIDSITDASNANPYIVLLKAGSHLVPQDIEIKSFVTVKGEGRDETFISLSEYGGAPNGGLFLSNRSSIMNLSINDNPFNLSTALLCADQSQRILIRNVSVRAAVAARFDNCKGIVVERSKFTGTAGDVSSVLQSIDSVISISDSEFTGGGTMLRAFGLTALRSVLTLSRVRVNIRSRDNIDETYGVINDSGSMIANDLTITVNSNKPVSMYNMSSSVVLNDLTITSVG